MKCLLGILLLILIGPKLWANSMGMTDMIPDGAFFMNIMLNPFTPYLYQLKRKSIIRYPSDTCRQFLIQEAKEGQESTEKVFSFCIQRTMAKEQITEILSFMVNHNNAGKMTIIRKGDHLAPTPNEELFQLKIPLPGQSSIYEWSFEGLETSVSYTRKPLSSVMLLKYFHNESTTIKITETNSEQTKIQSYQITCPDGCSSIPTHTAITNINEFGYAQTAYYFSNQAGKITPQSFNQSLSMYFHHSFKTIGTVLLRDAQADLAWPQI